MNHHLAPSRAAQDLLPRRCLRPGPHWRAVLGAALAAWLAIWLTVWLGPALADSDAGQAGSAAPGQGLSALQAAFLPSDAQSGGVPAGESGVRVVVVRDHKAAAYLDGRFVREGDVVKGMKVVNVSPQGVLLVHQDGTRERVALNPQAVKISAAPAVTKQTRGENQP
ncbi:MAG: hypothetical protein JOY60_02305 [Burkholderiaceae bacterium]|nr:hypothetical protein [Roseateles sp.]MBV8468685.1 hypothetical protein [Burkholderiaceae bacterium]